MFCFSARVTKLDQNSRKTEPLSSFFKNNQSFFQVTYILSVLKAGKFESEKANNISFLNQSNVTFTLVRKRNTG